MGSSDDIKTPPYASVFSSYFGGPSVPSLLIFVSWALLPTLTLSLTGGLLWPIGLQGL